jgi:LAS superfamily LD-carboxypeptidase LdcB
MTAPDARRIALVGVVAAVAVGLAVAWPLTPDEPSLPSAKGSSSAAPLPGPSARPDPSPPSSPPAADPATVEVPEAKPPGVRVEGADVYAVSVAASRAAFPGRSRAPVVYLASGTSLAEAYGAVPAAAVRGGPVLLARAGGIPEATAAELDRLRPERIVLVGGPTVLGRDVARAAAQHAPTVERIDGAGADGTSAALARGAFPSASAAWVVAGDRPEHAVVASAAAGATRSPLLVVDAGADRLPVVHADLLRDLGVTSVTVVGSTGAVSAAVAADLERVVGRGRVTRAGGADRNVVAARVEARTRAGRPAGVAYVANGRSPTTAFAGASLAALSRRPLLYALPYCVPATVRDAVSRASVTRVVLVGSERSVRRLVGRRQVCRSISDPTSSWVLVNRRNPLSPRMFEPSDLMVPPMAHAGDHQLRRDAARALGAMASAVADASGRVGIDTAYRSYATQDALYDARLAERGRTWTDTWYARPGYSEHQAGLAVDLLPVGESNCTINDCIDETPQGRWLARNSWRYGYILRYEKGYRSTVGLGFEPWHFRYVGTELARAYHEGGWHTLEGFLGEPPAPSY